MVLVVITTVAVVIMASIVWINRIEESSEANERCIGQTHQQDGDARRPPCQVGKVCFNFMVMSLFFGLFERLDFSLACVGCFCVLIGVLCIFILMNGIFVSMVFDVRNTNAHGGEGKNTDGQEHATDQHGAHPDAVLNMCFSAAHSSPSNEPTTIPFGSALINRSISVGSSL